ncbi:putative NBD/HSP70 family sugar kinase [Deinobacterium chartae]|uniref:Putative NBD/HSP70 family sugar kinase n=1 Tax=Deinobacterium chartae TaxID=521158 RepID=A0A841HY34_9DEIO|nr:ROK family transcriptional regulator [Deinobacterium chartae]MBB6097806.1 putative NBD/HSP70 family sugar kinase [Deinobacterium chartae]
MSDGSLDLAAIRVQHTLMLLRALWEHDLSRADLARRFGLSRSAVSSIVADLLEAGLVIELSPGASSGGRKPTPLRLQARAAHLLAVDLGARHLSVAVTDLRGHTLARNDRSHSVLEGPQATYAAVESASLDLLASTGIPLGSVAMVGIGIPGPVDHHSGRVVQPPNMRGWDDENVAEQLARRLGRPVLVENDANLGALAEARFGAERGERDLIYLKVATGIGAGILLGGQLLRGARGGAGEIGHISINESGPAGRSGNPGSLESYAAADVLLERARSRSGDLSLEVRDLVRRARSGDPLALEVWRETGEHLGVAIATLLNLFNPAAVVLGGQLAAAGDALLQPAREVALRRTLRINRESVRISASTLGADAGLLGSVSLLLDALFTPRWLAHLTGVARAARAQGGRAPPPSLSRPVSSPTLPAFPSPKESV